MSKKCMFLVSALKYLSLPNWFICVIILFYCKHLVCKLNFAPNFYWAFSSIFDNIFLTFCNKMFRVVAKTYLIGRIWKAETHIYFFRSHSYMYTSCLNQMGRSKRIWYLSPMRAAKVQASLRIRAVSPEPPLLAYTSSESRGTFRQKARSLALLNGWACAVKICHDGMLEDTSSLDATQMTVTEAVE